MAGNNSIQILRGTRESLVNHRDDRLLPGQLLYNDTDNYLTVGRLDNSSGTTSAPICCRSIKGYLGEDDGLSLNSTDKLIPYSLTTSSNEVIMTVNGKVGFTVHKNGYMNLFQAAIAERHPIRYKEYVEDMAKKVDKQGAIAGLYTFYGKRKLPTEGDEWIQYENGEECVFRGGYFPNSYSEFDKGDRRVVMYGKMGTFSVDMAEDRNFTYDVSTMGKHVTNRNYVDSAISAEAATRAAEDADIRNKLSAEVATRAAEDANIRSALAAEAATRAAEDDDIRAKYVPRIDYSGTIQSQEYQLYASYSGNSAFLLDVHKGAVSNTIMMRDSSGTSSIATPSEWMKNSTNLEKNAQKIVNVNMLTEYVSYLVPRSHCSNKLYFTVVQFNDAWVWGDGVPKNNPSDAYVTGTFTIKILSNREFTEDNYSDNYLLYYRSVIGAHLILNSNFAEPVIIHDITHSGVSWEIKASLGNNKKLYTWTVSSGEISSLRCTYLF